jgi:hypothetical protein
LQAFHSALGEDSQIYSPDEDVNSFGLFDKEIEEERDERLAFLTELRDFKDQAPDEFRRIRSLPLRARCGRRNPATAGHSLVFIRNDRRDAFYGINGQIEEMSFVEMARAFRAEPTEQSVPLHDAHHNHVLAALEDFQTKQEADAVRERAVDHTLGPNEQKAIRLLAAAQSMPNISVDERALFLAARLARFQELPRKINALQRAVAKTPVTMAVYLDKLAEIVRSYPLIADEPATRQPEQLELPGSFVPDIILSESFSASAKGDTGLPLRAIAAALTVTRAAPQAEQESAE